MKAEGRVALVTGAATGMGRAISLLLAAEGAQVAVNYHSSREAAERIVEEIRAQGGEARAFAADVGSEPDVKAMIAGVEQTFGRLDYLVNNAGWTRRVVHERLDELTDEIWNRTLDVNLRGPFYCTRSATPLLRRQPGAAVVNIASVAAAKGEGSSMIYAASKAALLTMTQSLARVLAPEIRVNAISPGLVQTGFAAWPDSLFPNTASVTPLQRIPSVEDVATTTLFLLVDAVSITGENVVLDGGLLKLGKRAG